MKSKLITKVLLIALSLVFVVAAFASCGASKDEFNELSATVYEMKKDTIDNGDSIEEIQEKIETLETKKVVAELQALADQIKATADAAATQTALAEAKAALETADTTNKEATDKAIADAKAALEASAATDKAAASQALADAKAALEAADANNKEATDDAIAAAKTALEQAIENNAAADATTKAALEAAIAELEGAVSDNEADIEAKLKALADDLRDADSKAADELTKVMNDLKAADEDIKEATNNAIEAAKTALNEAIADNAAADATTKAALEAAIAELEGAVSDNEADIEAKLEALADELSDADSKAAVALEAAKAELAQTIADNKQAAEDALAEAVKELDEAYKAADAAIQEQLNTLKEQYNVLSGKVAAIEELLAGMKDTDETVAAEIADIKEQLKLLGSDISVKMDAFISGYDLASKILAGEAVIDDFANEEEYNTYKDLSLEKFDARIKIITDRESWYMNIGGVAAEEYEAFDLKTKNIRFFIGRATSKEAVKVYFDKLQSAIDELMTLDELFVAAVDDIINNKKVTDEAESYETATKIKTEIENVSPVEPPIVIPDEYIAKYELIVAAQENLAAAFAAVDADVEAYIALIDDTVIYGVSETEIVDARDCFVAFETLYFKRDEVVELVKLYDETKYAATILVENYSVLTKAEARVIELESAFAAKPEIIEVVENFDTARPLWTDYDAIKTLDDAITAWTNGNDGWAALESENVEAILGAGKNALVDRALDYATAMKGFYDKYNKDGALKALVEDFNDDELQLYSRYDEFTGAKEDLDALEKAIKAYVDYDAALDTNFVTMIGEDNIEFFRGDKVDGQMKRLHTAYETIRGYKLAIENYIVVDGGVDDVNIYDYDAINTIKLNIETAYHIPGIQIDDANYEIIVKPAMDAYDRWVAAYKVKTAKIAEVYSALNKAMTTGYTLAEGNEVVRINNLVLDLVRYYGVGNLNVTVYVDDETFNLKDVVNAWNKFAGEFRDNAELAEEEAKGVNALITDAFKGLSTDDLNNYKEITDAYNAFKAWADKYLGGVYTKEAVEAIQEIYKINDPESTYTFVLLEVFEILDSKNSAVEARKELSEDEWANVADKFGALADKWTVGSEKTETEWDIHSKSAFEEAETAYKAFVEKFYAGNIIGTDYNGELAAYALFTAEYDEFKELMVTVNAEFDAINDAIDALMADGLENIDASDVDGIQAIRAMIASFKASYDCDVLTCAGGYAITAEQRIFLARAQAKAAYTAEYDEAVVEANGDASKLSALRTVLDNADQLIGEASIDGNTNTIASVYDFAVSGFAEALA